MAEPLQEELAKIVQAPRAVRSLAVEKSQDSEVRDGRSIFEHDIDPRQH
jgi:hypothetical protein